MEQTSKKILILYTSVGLGHKSMAENIGYYLVTAGFEVRLEDNLQVNRGALVTAGRVVYYWISSLLPFIWSFLYRSQGFSDLTLPWRLKVAGRNYQKLWMLVREFQPDLIISTHTTASAVVAFLKQHHLYFGKFGIAFSDFHLHRYWLYEQADFYLANIVEQKSEMLRLGIPEQKIFVCGMSLKPKSEVDRSKVKTRLGITPGEKIILLGSGSQGLGISRQTLQALCALPDTRVIAVCGKNQELLLELQAWKNSHLLALPYYSPMEELYAIADFFVTKPGGLSVSEALRFYLPMLIDHVLPGQEEYNYFYLLKNRLVMPRPKDMAAAIVEENRSHLFQEQLRHNPALSKLFPDPVILQTSVRKILEI